MSFRTAWEKAYNKMFPPVSLETLTCVNGCGRHYPVGNSRWLDEIEYYALLKNKVGTWDLFYYRSGYKDRDNFEGVEQRGLTLAEGLDKLRHHSDYLSHRYPHSYKSKITELPRYAENIAKYSENVGQSHGMAAVERALKCQMKSTHPTTSSPPQI